MVWGSGDRYCSWCEKILLQNGITCYAEKKIGENGCIKYTYYYQLEKEGCKLVFRVLKCISQSRVSKNEEEQWKDVYKAAFAPNSKTVEVLCDDEGNLDTWAELIYKNVLDPLACRGRRLFWSKEKYELEELRTIRSVFPIIQQVLSLKMFFSIYQEKGLNWKQIIPDGMEERYYTINNDSFCDKTAYPKDGRFKLNTCLHDCDSEKVLEIDFVSGNRNGGSNYRFLISKDYINRQCKGWFSDEEDEDKNVVSYLLNCCNLDDVEIGDNVEADIMNFDARYPEFGLKTFWERGQRNIFYPLLSGQLHKGLDILSKAGLFQTTRWASDRIHYDPITIMRKDPRTYNDIESLLGIPLFVAHKVDKERGFFGAEYGDVFKTLEVIHQTNPQFLSYPKFYSPMCHYFMYQDTIQHQDLQLVEAETKEITWFFDYCMKIFGEESLFEQNDVRTVVVKTVDLFTDRSQFLRFIDYMQWWYYIYSDIAYVINDDWAYIINGDDQVWRTIECIKCWNLIRGTNSPLDNNQAMKFLRVVESGDDSWTDIQGGYDEIFDFIMPNGTDEGILTLMWKLADKWDTLDAYAMGLITLIKDRTQFLRMIESIIEDFDAEKIRKFLGLWNRCKGVDTSLDHDLALEFFENYIWERKPISKIEDLDEVLAFLSRNVIDKKVLVQLCEITDTDEFVEKAVQLIEKTLSV